MWLWVLCPAKKHGKWLEPAGAQGLAYTRCLWVRKKIICWCRIYRGRCKMRLWSSELSSQASWRENKKTTGVNSTGEGEKKDPWGLFQGCFQKEWPLSMFATLLPGVRNSVPLSLGLSIFIPSPGSASFEGLIQQRWVGAISVPFWSCGHWPKVGPSFPS